jgi:hypothetical protein
MATHAVGRMLVIDSISVSDLSFLIQHSFALMLACLSCYFASKIWHKMAPN